MMTDCKKDVEKIVESMPYNQEQVQCLGSHEERDTVATRPFVQRVMPNANGTTSCVDNEVAELRADFESLDINEGGSGIQDVQNPSHVSKTFVGLQNELHKLCSSSRQEEQKALHSEQEGKQSAHLNSKLKEEQGQKDLDTSDSEKQDIEMRFLPEESSRSKCEAVLRASTSASAQQQYQVKEGSTKGRSLVNATLYTRNEVLWLKVKDREEVKFANLSPGAMIIMKVEGESYVFINATADGKCMFHCLANDGINRHEGSVVDTKSICWALYEVLAHLLDPSKEKHRYHDVAVNAFICWVAIQYFGYLTMDNMQVESGFELNKCRETAITILKEMAVSLSKTDQPYETDDQGTIDTLVLYSFVSGNFVDCVSDFTSGFHVHNTELIIQKIHNVADSLNLDVKIETNPNPLRHAMLHHIYELPATESHKTQKRITLDLCGKEKVETMVPNHYGSLALLDDQNVPPNVPIYIGGGKWELSI